MKIHPEFPAHRRGDPQRRAELAIYNELAASAAPGFALYETRAHSTAPETDFALWLEDVAHYGIGVKGGLYSMEQGRLILHTPHGPVKKPGLLKHSRDAAFSIKDVVAEQLQREIFVIAVLIFPDMQPDPDIEERAARDYVHVLWGSDNIVPRLIALTEGDVVYIHRPPTAREIEEEVAVIMPGLTVATAPEADPAEVAPPPAAMELAARQVIIQHADVVNVYTSGDQEEGG